MSEIGRRQPPRFCPGCGAELRDTEKTRPVVAIGRPGTLDNAELEPDHPWGWDCYCASCGWSGDISRDEVFDDPPPKKPKAKNKSAAKKTRSRHAIHHVGLDDFRAALAVGHSTGRS